MRADVFACDSLQQQIGLHVRSVGRPRQAWSTEVWKAGVEKLGSAERLETLIQDEPQWKAALKKIIRHT